jgi:IS30 family transposase
MRSTPAVRCFRKVPRRWRKTIATDNGSEFVEHKQLASRLGFKTFFANSHSSRKRGTNENTNDLSDSIFPKTPT